TLRNEGCILTMITVCFLPFLRKAISRSGLHYLGPPQPSLPPASNGPTKELRTCVDWTENAVNGDHLWMETSCSGELCYLGEDTCVLKTAVSNLYEPSAVTFFCIVKKHCDQRNCLGLNCQK
uniref:Uncharacterized protein n=1 Tax=Haplochromis burtoni TaxID=8153 RepID=A0A3Q2V613_HAPBU